MKDSGDAVIGAIVASWGAVHGPALFRAINNALQMVFGATRATLLVHGTRQDGVVVSASDAQSAELESLEPESPATRALLDGEAVVIGDVAAAATDDPWCRVAQYAGVGSAVGLPLRVGWGTIGAVGLYHDEPGRFQAGTDARAKVLLFSAAQAMVAELMGRGLNRAIDVDVPQWPGAGSRWRGIAAVTPAAEGLAFLRGLAAEQGLSLMRSTTPETPPSE